MKKFLRLGFFICGAIWINQGLAEAPTERIIVEGVNVPIDSPSSSLIEALPAFSHTFERPIYLTHAPDGSDRLFVVEQGGVIKVLSDSTSTAEVDVFLDISDRIRTIGNEEGLLGLAFDPNYRESGRFYVYYSAKPNPRKTVLARYQVSSDSNKADRQSEEVLLEIAQPYSNHNGGMLDFGNDGLLYISVGDGGSGGDPQNVSQNLSKLLGKILRIDVSGTGYSIPMDNPFVGVVGARPEIYAYGLRNVWRFSFDRATGDLWAGDVGQSAREEIDKIVSGGNYGWRLFEGTRPYNNPSGVLFSSTVAPVFEYPRSEGQSITGGYLYRGSTLVSLRGKYIYGDYVAGNIWSLSQVGDEWINTKIGNIPLLASFGLNRDGEMFAMSLMGTIYRLKEKEGSIESPRPKLLSQTGLFKNVANLSVKDGILEYKVNTPLWSDGAFKRRWMVLPGTEQIDVSEINQWEYPVGTIFIKHFELSTPTGMQRVETRLFVHETAGWAGYTYRWNEEQSDASLLDSSQSETFNVINPDGTSESLVWQYPSRSQCMQCHTAASGRVLGANLMQLNRSFNYQGELFNQVEVYKRIEFFNQPVSLASSLPSLPNSYDSTLPIAQRARAYMEVNCANCHQPFGPTPTNLDLRYDVALENTKLVGEKLNHIRPLSENERRLVPGKPNDSALLRLVSSREGDYMPPLGSQKVDVPGELLLKTWIESIVEIE